MSDPKQMPFSLNLDGDAINQFFASAVLESTFGERVRKAVDEALSERYSRRDVITSTVNEVIREQAKIMLLNESDIMTRIRNRLRDAAVEKLTDDVLDRLIENAMSRRFE